MFRELTFSAIIEPVQSQKNSPWWHWLMLLNVFTDQKLNDFPHYTFDLEMSHDYVLIAAIENAECTFNNNHKLIKGKFELLRIYLFKILI